jgi:hypothetical protein
MMRAIPLLLALLLAPHLLGQDDPARQAADLVRKLGSDKADEREEGIRKLKALGKAALPALEKAARDPDEEVSARARDLLRRIALRDSLSLREKQLLPGIEDRLDPDQPLRWTQAFLELVERSEGRAKHPELQREDLEVLAAPALRGAEAEQRYFVLREIQRRRLKSAGTELLKLLQSPDFNVYFHAGQTLEAVPTQEVLREVVKLIEDPRPMVRHSAIHLVVAWRAREAIPALLRLHPWEAENDKSSDAAQALIALRAREAIPALRASLRSGNRETVQQAAWALSELRALEAVPDLIALLEHKDPFFRGAAAGSLSSLKVRETIPAIGKLLDDSEQFARSSALQALDQSRLPAGDSRSDRGAA